MKNKKAFTLAEVLICLSVVGLIAAITIPSLVNNSSKKANAQSYKKAMVALNNIVERSITDSRFQPTPSCFYWEKSPYGNASCVKWDDKGNCTKYEHADGSSIESDYNGPMSQCNDLFAYIKENLQIVKECANGNAYAGGCTPEYEGNDTNIKNNNPNSTDYDINKATSGCSGWRKENLKKRNAYVLSDGSIIILYGTGAQLLTIDTNGKKGPNKWGYDVWPMTLKGNKGYTPMYRPGGCEFTEKGGISSSSIFSSNY